MTDMHSTLRLKPLIRPAFSLCAVLVIALLSILWSPASRAALEVDITRGKIEPMPIALPNFLGSSPEEQQYGVDLVSVIGSNLERSGLFMPVPQAAYIEQISSFEQPPRFGDWRTIKAQALVTGRVSVQQDGRLRAEFRLWAVFAG